MRAEQRPPTVGIVAGVGYLVAAFLPYLVLSSAEVQGLQFYYADALVDPQYLSILAVVSVVLFAAGRQRRSDPDYVAGLTLVLGAVLALVVVAWAAFVPNELVLSIGTADWLQYHRWLLAGCALLIAACAAWYARVLSLV